MPECKPQYHLKIQLTFGGHVDALSLRREFERSQMHLIYQAWLQSARLQEILEQNQLQMDLPATFSLITNEKLKVFYIQKWLDCYDQIKWTFDHWFSKYGHKIPWPKADPPDRNEMSRYALPTWPHHGPQKLTSNLQSKQKIRSNTCPPI